MDKQSITEADINTIVKACLEDVRFRLSVQSKFFGLDTVEIYNVIEYRLHSDFTKSIQEVIYGNAL